MKISSKSASEIEKFTFFFYCARGPARGFGPWLAQLCARPGPAAHTARRAAPVPWLGRPGGLAAQQPVDGSLRRPPGPATARLAAERR